MSTSGYADIVNNVLQNRRSTRKYCFEEIPENVLFSIAKAGTFAPSSGNGQPCRFLIINDNAVINNLLDYSIQENEQLVTEEQKQLYSSWSNNYRQVSAVIIILEDKESPYPEYIGHDCPLAAANIIIMATSMGYGTTYVTDTISEKGIRKACNISDRYIPYCAILIGKSCDTVEKHKKKNAEEVIWINSVPNE